MTSGQRGWHAAALAFVLLQAWLFGSEFVQTVLFNMDVERDLGRALDLVSAAGLSMRGPDISSTGLHLGPLTYFLIAPVVLVLRWTRWRSTWRLCSSTASGCTCCF